MVETPDTAVMVGTPVMVRWADGSEYPAVVTGVQDGHCCCRFENGSESWVGSPYLRVVQRTAVPQAPLAPLGLPAKKTSSAAVVGAGSVVLAGAIALLVNFAPWSSGDREVASYARDASGAMLDAALGRHQASRWEAADATRDLRATKDEVPKVLAILGPSPTIVLVTLELQAVQPRGLGHTNVRGQAAVLANGDFRWLALARNEYDFPPLSKMSGLARAEPVLADAIFAMLSEMREKCLLPALQETDVRQLPERLRRDLLRQVESIPRACNESLAEDGWEPVVDEVTVLVEGGGKWAALRSKLRLEGGSLVLAPVEAKLLSFEPAAQAAHVEGFTVPAGGQRVTDYPPGGKLVPNELASLLYAFKGKQPALVSSLARIEAAGNGWLCTDKGPKDVLCKRDTRLLSLSVELDPADATATLLFVSVLRNMAR